MAGSEQTDAESGGADDPIVEAAAGWVARPDAPFFSDRDSFFIRGFSGIVTHKRIFSDFFTFRRDKAPRRSFLDAHNVTGVLALPFHLMITYTGVVALATFYMPWGVTAAYKGDTRAFFAEAGWITAPRLPAGRPAPLAPLGPMIEQAQASVPERLERLTVTHFGDAGATIVAMFEEPHGLAHTPTHIAFDGASGALLEIRGGDLKPAARTISTLIGLHVAHFADTGLRLLFFLCGIMGSAMVATGLVLWSLARLPRASERPFFGLRLVQALNIGSIAGLPAAIAVSANGSLAAEANSDLVSLCDQAIELAAPVLNYEEAALEAGWAASYIRRCPIRSTSASPL